MLFEGHDAWWSCKRDEAPYRDERIVAVGPTRHIDQPQLVTVDDGRLYNYGGAERIDDGHYDRARLRVIAGQGRSPGPRAGSGRSTGAACTGAGRVDEGDTVLGILAELREEDPALVTVSRSGLVVRLRRCGPSARSRPRPARRSATRCTRGSACWRSSATSGAST